MGCGAALATGLGFVCFVVINPCVLPATELIWASFLFVSQIAQSYPQVLKDEEKRQLYDQFGAEAAERGTPPPQNPFGGFQVGLMIYYIIGSFSYNT